MPTIESSRLLRFPSMTGSGSGAPIRTLSIPRSSTTTSWRTRRVVPVLSELAWTTDALGSDHQNIAATQPKITTRRHANALFRFSNLEMRCSRERTVIGFIDPHLTDSLSALRAPCSDHRQPRREVPAFRSVPGRTDSALYLLRQHFPPHTSAA